MSQALTNIRDVKILITGAFILVAGNAWSAAITAGIDYVVPRKSSGVIAKVVYAILVTILVSFLIRIVSIMKV